VIDYGNMHLSIGSGLNSGFAGALAPGAYGGAGGGLGQQRRTVAFKQPHQPRLGSANSLSVSTRHGDSAFLLRSGPGDSTFTIRSSEGGGHSQVQSNSHTHTPQSQSQGQSRAHSQSQSHSTLPTSAVESSPGHSGAGVANILVPLPGRTPPGLSNLGRSPGNRRPGGLTAMRESTTSVNASTALAYGAPGLRDSKAQYRDRSDGEQNYYSSGYARTAGVGMPSDTSIPQVSHHSRASHTSNTALAGSGRASTGGMAGASGFMTGRSRRTNPKGPAARAREANERRFEEELIMYLDGTRHADEIQVKFGLGWSQLEAILGLELGMLKDGKGKKGVALIYR
jgi:hypothetical protein